jgi:hypothetical protein
LSDFVQLAQHIEAILDEMIARRVSLPRFRTLGSTFTLGGVGQLLLDPMPFVHLSAQVHLR